MPFYAILCGLVLAAVGALSYMQGTPEAETGKVSPTALIPMWFGVALAACGFLVLMAEPLRKALMHLAALIGLFGAVGGLMPIYRQVVVKNNPFDPMHPPVRTGLIMSAICVIFVVLCVRSFIAARRARATG